MFPIRGSFFFKKTAVAVDAAFFSKTLGPMQAVSDVSNAEIARFTAEFDEAVQSVRLVIDPPHNGSLKRAVEAFTGR